MEEPSTNSLRLKNRCRLAFFVTLIAIFCGLSTAAAADEAGAAIGPKAAVKESVDQVISLLTDTAYAKDPALRREKILDAIDHRFDFELMSRLALGKTWKTISDEQQKMFVGLFASLLQNTYIKRIESYSDEKIEFTREKVKKSLAVVYSVFKKNNEDYSIVYKLKNTNNDWLVYDVIIEGASIVKQYRRQFSRIVAEESFDSLVARLDEKVKKLKLASRI